MDYSKSFMYVLTNYDKTNIDQATYFYDVNFGGFSEPYDDYNVEVVSIGVASGLQLKYIIFLLRKIWLPMDIFLQVDYQIEKQF